VPDGVLVRRRRTQIKAEKPHPGEPVADPELHFGVTRIVLSLQGNYSRPMIFG